MQPAPYFRWEAAGLEVSSQLSLPLEAGSQCWSPLPLLSSCAKLPYIWASSDTSSFLGEILMVNFSFFLHFLKLWQPSWYSPDQAGVTLVSRFMISPLCTFRSSAQCFYRKHQTQLLLICPKAHTHIGIQSEIKRSWKTAELRSYRLEATCLKYKGGWETFTQPATGLFRRPG